MGFQYMSMQNLLWNQELLQFRNPQAEFYHFLGKYFESSCPYAKSSARADKKEPVPFDKAILQFKPPKSFCLLNF